MIPIVRLVGPGGAGKTTVGRHLAERLGWHFLDLDQAFMAEHGDIRACIEAQGYEAYARANVALHAGISQRLTVPTVLALSSGFMTYPDTAHPGYVAQRRRIEGDPLTVLLLPSFDLEICTRIIVERQLARPYLRGDRRAEAARLQARFDAFMGLRCPRCLSDGPPEEVARHVYMALAPVLRGWVARHA